MSTSRLPVGPTEFELLPEAVLFELGLEEVVVEGVELTVIV
jgi:hypothetical protein